MNEDKNYVLVDGDYSVPMKLDANSKQIRTKQSSFTSINDKYNDFRLKLLNKKLEEEKKSALNVKYVANADGLLKPTDEEDMLKRAKVIAKLEKKIKILTGDEVPNNYVSRRAIKIKKAMMDNIKSKSVIIYTVGQDKGEKVFDQTVVEGNADDFSLEKQNFVTKVFGGLKRKNEELKVENAQVANFVPSAVCRSEIRNAIDEAFEDVMVQESEQENVVNENNPHINLEDIKASIDEAFNEQELNIGKEHVFEGRLEDLNTINIDYSDAELEDVAIEMDESLNQFVSKNGSSSVKLDQFYEDGTRKEKYDYVPMTDEEIRAAQANIEYDKYEEVYNNQNVKSFDFKTAEFKDIFAPVERNFEQFKFVAGEDEKEVNTFVTEPVEEKTIEVQSTSYASTPSSLDEFNELKAKVAELKKKLAESESRKNSAVQFATTTATRAEEAKRDALASEKKYQDKIPSLQLLVRTLEENCNLNDNAAHAAIHDAECNERFINSQLTKKNQYDEAISQVDSMLGFSENEEEVEHVRRVA